MLFVLTGPNQGKTMRVGSAGCHFQFVDGQCDIPDDAKDGQSLVQKFYSAHPAHLCKQLEDGRIVKLEETPVVVPSFVRKPNAVREIEPGAMPPEPPAFDLPSTDKKPAKK